MKNSKFIFGFAACGFLLSFVAGLFSHSGFGHIILMAAVFAVVFGALAFFIQFLMDGVLSIDGQTVPAEAAAESVPKTGGVVDITIQDEELPAEENSPQFFVGDNHQMLNKNDYSAEGSDDTGFSRQSESSIADVDTIQEADTAVPESKSSEIGGEADSDDGFVPVPLQETAKNMSGAESVSPSDDDIINLEDDTLDELPELKDLKPAGAADYDDVDVVEDSDFSNAGDTKKTDVKNEIKDATIMAKAISTVLAKEKENQ
ncbi:MAG TPA: hypothetical protein DCL73_14770 [Treponema sp.]|nr:hypothetical protein [Treponema sp.]